MSPLATPIIRNKIEEPPVIDAHRDSPLPHPESTTSDDKVKLKTILVVFAVCNVLLINLINYCKICEFIIMTKKFLLETCLEFFFFFFLGICNDNRTTAHRKTTSSPEKIDSEVLELYN